jgi:pimeloyl-ACP methyl ester carboxylesterase
MQLMIVCCIESARVLDDSVEGDVLADHDLSHLGSPITFPAPTSAPILTKFMPFPPVDEAELAELTDLEQKRVARIERFIGDQFGFAQIQSTRPQTLAYGLTDSPVGQLAWIVEKFKEWTHPSAELPEAAVDRDRILTDVMIYWLTRTAGPSARLYYEGAHAGDWGRPEEPSKTPTGVAVFAEDVSIRRYAERGNNIVHWSDFDRGGHFAALEEPELLTDDIRVFFRDLR